MATLTVKDLVKYLRLSVNVVDPDSNERDELYLKLSDEDLTLYLNMARTRAFADESLDNFPEELMYPLMLLAKKELYMALAIRHASYVDIGADDNNYLKKSQWFDHYMKLAKNVDDDYQAYLDQGGAGSNTVYSASTYLNTRYYTSYNYEKAVLPYIKARIDNTTVDTIEVSWDFTVDRYLCVQVFISKHPIADTYEVNKSQVSDLSKEVAVIRDPHIKRCRIGGCEANTDYYVLVAVTDWAGRTVFEEMKAVTSSDELTDDEVLDVSL